MNSFYTGLRCPQTHPPLPFTTLSCQREGHLRTPKAESKKSLWPDCVSHWGSALPSFHQCSHLFSICHSFKEGQNYMPDWLGCPFKPIIFSLSRSQACQVCFRQLSSRPHTEPPSSMSSHSISVIPWAHHTLWSTVPHTHTHTQYNHSLSTGKYYPESAILYKCKYSIKQHIYSQLVYTRQTTCVT